MNTELIQFQAHYGEFCREVLANLDSEVFAKTFIFDETRGLCFNFDTYVMSNRICSTTDLARFQRDLFGDYKVYPFNPLPEDFSFSELTPYGIERNEGKLYENEARLEHIRKYAEEFK